MKKFAILLFIGVLFGSCNDGDLYFDNLNFPGNIQKCSTKEIYYKLNGNEMLILNMNNISIDSLPLNEEFSTSASSNILYRQYSDRAISGSICDLLAPAFPQVVQEFTVKQGGTINYKRIRRITQNQEEGKIGIQYINTFNFNNIVLVNGDKELKFENYNFGEYINSSVNFNLNLGSLYKCDSSNDLYSSSAQQLFKISNTDLTFPNAVGTQSINLNSSNYLTLYFLSGVINANEACSLSFNNPETEIKEEWQATEGILEIVTTAISTQENPEIITGYRHSLIIKNAVFINNDSDSFTVNEQIIGIYSPTNNNE